MGVITPQLEGGALWNRKKSVGSHLRRGAQTNETQSFVGERRVSILMESVSPRGLQR